MKKIIMKTLSFLSLIALCLAVHASAPSTPQGAYYTINTKGGTCYIECFLDTPTAIKTISFTANPAATNLTPTPWTTGLSGVSSAATIDATTGLVTVEIGQLWNKVQPQSGAFALNFSITPPSVDLISLSNVIINGTIGLTTQQVSTLPPLPSSGGGDSGGTTPATPPITFSYVTPVDPSPGYISTSTYPAMVFEPYTDVTLNSASPWTSPTDLKNKYNIIYDGSFSLPVGAFQMVKDTGLKGVRFAFITEDSGNIGWGANPLNFALPVVQQLQSQGITVILSLGGANGTFPGTNEGTYKAFYNYLEQIITTYPGVGLCFDIEGADPLGISGNETMQTAFTTAAAAIQQKYDTPMILTLPALPSGLNAGGQAVVTAAQQAGLDFYVNIMAMDYGSNADGKDATGTVAPMSQLAIQAAQSTARFLQTVYPTKSATWCLQRVQVTPMIGYNDVTTEVFTLADAQTLMTWAKDNGVQLCMWSLTRDFPGGTKTDLVSATFSGPGIQITPYQFSKIFEGIDQ